MRIIGQQRVSDLFGVSRETIDTWQQLGFPVAVRGGPGVPSEYESDECIRWLIERELSKVQPETPSNRLALAKAAAVEMDNVERRRQLISAAALEPKLKAALMAVREMWRGEPARLALETEGKSLQVIEDLLDVAFRDFLVRVSQWPHATKGAQAK